MGEPCTAYIRRVVDGVVRACQMEWYPENDHPEFIWEEGNFACDCNRHLFFERADGREPDDDECQCSSDRYVIDKIVLHNGQLVYTEDESVEIG